ncbi:porin family protein [Vibrio sp. T187]|uniref:outer membrane beta-barrel protein n=1 Tax=Vibrio TaxID=662 RepID=UPI0010C93766|nr:MULTISPECIES: outer membrane beta-barrel protein [Vibrio]MBW3694867.1 porin family protein [Vibrio sp. T187]
MKKTLLTLALIGASSTAMADSWIYAGGQLGQSNVDSENGTTSGVHIGTGILPFIGLEAGYMNFGEINIAYNNLTADASFSSFYLAAKPSIDFGPLHVYAKGGLNSYSVDYSGTIGQLLSEDTGVGIMYGVGAEYFVLDMLSVGASYQSFGMEIDGDSVDVTSFTLNATVHFL